MSQRFCESLWTSWLLVWELHQLSLDIECRLILGKCTGYPQEPAGGKTECMWRQEDHIHKGEACLRGWGCEDFHEERELGSQLARSRGGRGDFTTAHKWRKEVLRGWRKERVKDETGCVRVESWIEWGPKNLRSYGEPWTAPAGLWSVAKSGGLGPTWGLIGMQVPQPHLDSHPRVCVLMIPRSHALTAVNRPDLFSEATLNYWLGEGQKWTHRRSKKSALEIWRK